MNILLSAYGCSPILGSEPGVGWRWASILAQRNQVTLLTHPFFEEAINAELKERPCPNLQLVYYEPQGLGIRRKKGELNSRLYYIAWQVGAYRRARQLCLKQQFTLSQHITWGTFRFPSFLGLLEIPFVFGPVGGGEKSPARLLVGMPFKERAREMLRNAYMSCSSIDPLMRLGLRKASLILCKTAETMEALPAAVQVRARIAQEIGAPPILAPLPRQRTPGHIKLLYAGRLVGLKGIHFALRALALARARGVNASLIIIGDGPMERHLRTLATQLDIAEYVEFRGFVARDVLLGLYQDADAFIFPSLHDSSGNVVLEALSRGLPVICLDLGGPKYFIDKDCGRIISTEMMEEAGLCLALADSVQELARDPSLLEALSQGAFAQAQRLNWEDQIARSYQIIAEAGIGAVP